MCIINCNIFAEIYSILMRLTRWTLMVCMIHSLFLCAAPILVKSQQINNSIAPSTKTTHSIIDSIKYIFIGGNIIMCTGIYCFSALSFRGSSQAFSLIKPPAKYAARMVLYFFLQLNEEKWYQENRNLDREHRHDGWLDHELWRSHPIHIFVRQICTA